MGLDMYLKAGLYVSGYDFAGEESKERYQRLVDETGLRAAADPETPGADVKVTVAYWRKANAIHRWFVENVQDGEDDCDDHYVSREQLEALRDTCKKALEVADISEGQPVHSGTTWRPGQEQEENFVVGRAILNGNEVAEILPTQGGFFFGSTDYDEWYLSDLESTVKQIDRVLANLPENASLYYHSSW